MRRTQSSPTRSLRPTRLLTISAGALFTAASLSACGGEQEGTLAEAEETLEDYFNLVAAGNDDACDLETPSYAKENEEFFEEKDCGDRVDAAAALYKAFDVDLADAKFKAAKGEDDDEAIVTVSYDDDEDDESYVLVFEDGRWLVDDEADSDDDGGGGDGSDEGDDESEEPEVDDPTLSLTSGSSLTVNAADKDGNVSDETPFILTFDTLTCAASIPTAANDENYELTDLVAAAGNQVCIVELAVKNDSKGPGFYGSENDATLRTSDGFEYSATDKLADQDWLKAKDREPSYTSDMVQPGQTKYDVVAFELPADATPSELVYSIND